MQAESSSSKSSQSTSSTMNSAFNAFKTVTSYIGRAVQKIELTSDPADRGNFIVTYGGIVYARPSPPKGASSPVSQVVSRAPISQVKGNYRIFFQKRDGNCLFSAATVCLESIENVLRVNQRWDLEGSPIERASFLRKKVVEWMRANVGVDEILHNLLKGTCINHVASRLEKLRSRLETTISLVETTQANDFREKLLENMKRITNEILALEKLQAAFFGSLDAESPVTSSCFPQYFDQLSEDKCFADQTALYALGSIYDAAIHVVSFKGGLSDHIVNPREGDEQRPNIFFVFDGIDHYDAAWTIVPTLTV